MGNLQIKNVPEALHDELRARADGAGLTLRDYVLRLLERELAVPADWRQRLARLPEVDASVDVMDELGQTREGRTEQILRAVAAEDRRPYPSDRG
jgi:malonyl CoA-acyl carrier protein transacylase